MKKHVFQAVELGWNKEPTLILFDAEKFSRADAEAQFKPVERTTVRNDRLVLYTAYEYENVMYHRFCYRGLVDE